MHRWSVHVAALVALAGLSGCHKRAAPAAESKDGPHVALRGDTVFVDGTPAGTVRHILELGRLQRVDELHAKLKSLREAWKTGHPEGVFPGECVFELERGAKLLAVKSVVQTAAFAGYPNATLVVDGDAASPWVGHVHAQVPRPPAAPPPAPFLAVTVRPLDIALSWGKGANAPPDEQVVASAAGLRDAVAAMAARDGAHTSPSDRGLDEAVLAVPNDSDVAALTPVLDALDGVRRDVDGPDGKRSSVPVLTVALSVCPSGPCPEHPEDSAASPSGIGLLNGADAGGALGGLGLSGFGGRLGGGHPEPSVIRVGSVSVSGRLPPEVVQRIVRQNFGRFRLCYEQALATNPALAGDVTTKFVISAKGEVTKVSDGGSKLADPAAVSCVQKAFLGLSFPEPEGGTVTVVYPIHFEPAKPAP